MIQQPRSPDKMAAEPEGVRDRCMLNIGDIMEMPFPDSSFDCC